MKIKLSLVLLSSLIVAIFASSVYAGSDPNAFDPIWVELSGWAVNAPGKIVAFLTFGASIFLGVVKQNWLAALGAFIGAMLIAQAEQVITFFLDAPIPFV